LVTWFLIRYKLQNFSFSFHEPTRDKLDTNTVHIEENCFTLKISQLLWLFFLAQSIHYHEIKMLRR